MTIDRQHMPVAMDGDNLLTDSHIDSKAFMEALRGLQKKFIPFLDSSGDMIG